jgi:plastocyanin
VTRLLVNARVLLVAMPLLAGAAACFSSRGPTDNTGLPGECRFAPGSPVPGTTVVAIKNFAFTPAEVTVRAGGTVTWINCETAGVESHTSTADAGEWSSPTLAPEDVFSHTFPQPGRFTYHCTPHPVMTAAVVVE